MNIWYWIIGSIVGWILGDIVKAIGLGSSRKEDAMWAIIMWFFSNHYLLCDFNIKFLKSP